MMQPPPNKGWLSSLIISLGIGGLIASVAIGSFWPIVIAGISVVLVFNYVHKLDHQSKMADEEK